MNNKRKNLAQTNNLICIINLKCVGINEHLKSAHPFGGASPSYYEVRSQSMQKIFGKYSGIYEILTDSK